MESGSGMIIILTVLIVSAFLLIIYKLAEFFTEFNRDTRYILLEMNRAADSDEYRYWRRMSKSRRRKQTPTPHLRCKHEKL